ncbi:MAG: DMT family transporter [Bacteroidales bacterium]|nr:DMT family transporter [Bacteroidales bacterium]
MSNISQSRLLPWLILFVLVIIWGSSFILIKKGLIAFTHLQLGAIRISLTFLVLLPFTIGRFVLLKAREWKYLVIVGIVGGGLPAFLFAKAQTGIDSYMAGLLNSLTPLFTLILGLLFFGFRTKWFNILGILVALAGTVGLLYVGGGKSFDFNFKFGIYIVIATIGYALHANIVKFRLQNLDPVTITIFSFFVIGFPVLIYLSFFTPFFNQILHKEEARIAFGYIAILALLGTAPAVIIFNKLIKLTSAVFASSVTYLIPVIAIMWGINDGERFEFIYMVWIVLIFLGIFLVNFRAKGSGSG